MGRVCAWQGGYEPGGMVADGGDFDWGRTTLQVPLGLYIVRGDNIAIVGEVDPQLDAGTDWANLRAEPLQHIVH